MCPKYENATELLGKKWTGLIIRVLLDGPKRFKEIKEQFPEMSDKMLTDRMKELEHCSIIKPNVYPEMPVRIEYELSEKGQGLEPVIQSIQQWSSTLAASCRQVIGSFFTYIRLGLDDFPLLFNSKFLRLIKHGCFAAMRLLSQRLCSEFGWVRLY